MPIKRNSSRKPNPVQRPLSASLSSKEFCELFNEYDVAMRLQREAANNVNRLRTRLRDVFKDVASTNVYSHGNITGSYPYDELVIVIDGKAVTFEPSEQDRIPPEKWYKLWRDHEITDEQFFDALNVSKQSATLSAGADIVATLEEPMKGNKADIRVADAVPEYALVNFMLVPKSMYRKPENRPAIIKPAPKSFPKFSPKVAKRAIRKIKLRRNQ